MSEQSNKESNESGHHVVISADTHCGAALWDYKEYLEKRYHEDFDDWARSIEEGQRRTAEVFKDAERSPLNVGVDGDPAVGGNRNYDSAPGSARAGGRRGGGRGAVPQYPAALCPGRG
ncbi:MAG: hypothetical protein Ct9H300mP12_04550 [Acidimicrobiales bacterium]|nr:MAG: hypothetical protein Ct9H300mP12_04550 [Acidimicrobiales bacterium]